MMSDSFMSMMTTDSFGNQLWRDTDERLHRLDGPVVILADQCGEDWWICGCYATERVEAWIKENNFPDYALWTDGQKIMFRLAFSGISS